MRTAERRLHQALRDGCVRRRENRAPIVGSAAVIEAFFWGAVGASALLVGALVAYAATPSRKVIGAVMALGAGLLIGSISFELVDEALKTNEVAAVGLFTLVGAATFTLGDWLIERRGGGHRKDAEGAQASGSPLAIVFGSVLDGIPESFVLGLTVLQGSVSISLLVGVLLSNFPEGLSSASGLRIAGWPRGRVVRMWLVVIVVSAVSAALGYTLLDPAHGRTGGFAQGFAAGALLAMITNTMLPESYEAEGVSTGWLVSIGFAISLMLSAA
jgi:zinc transporter, ZIP family